MPATDDIRLDHRVLAGYGLPDIPYPPIGAHIDGDELPLAQMLRALQARSREGDAPWQSLEPAMDRLAALLTPEETAAAIVVTGQTWWLEIGPVNLTSPLVTIQRGGAVVAAIAAREDGRLRVAVFRPLDAKSAHVLIGLAQTPHPEHGVCLREHNWAYALDCASGSRHHYADSRSEAYLSIWEHGLGIDGHGAPVPEWHRQIGAVCRPAPRIATELRVYDEGIGTSAGPSTENAQEAPSTTAPAPPRWRPKRQQQRTVRGRFLGCVLGGAVGDALGAPLEFLTRAEIQTHFGPRGIVTYVPAYGGLGRITDDTQMTLFTAEGLLRGWVRGASKGITWYPGVTAGAYRRWLQTQGETPNSAAHRERDTSGWLIQQPQLHHRRAPGNTCLAALRAMTAARPARNRSKGCGGVMRVAPVGLFGWRLGAATSLEKVFNLGTDLAALTHGHPTGSLSGGTLAVMILALTDGAALPEALAAAKALLRSAPNHAETLQAIEQAEALADAGTPPGEAIPKLGQGWVADEALAIAIYCALVGRSFRHGVLLAVNHDGDSDSTGAIAGNLLGTLHGVKGIPAAWLEPLELRSVITELAEDLYDFADWTIGEYSPDSALSERIWRKYPGF